MNEQNRIKLREYLSEEAALLLENTMVFKRCLCAAWETGAGEEVEQLIAQLTRAATSAQQASRKLSDAPVGAHFEPLHRRIEATHFYGREP